MDEWISCCFRQQIYTKWMYIRLLSCSLFFFFFCQVIINNCSCNSGQSSKDKSSSSMTWKKNNSSFSCEKTKLYILLQNLKKVLRQEHRRQSDRWMESETKYSRTMRAISSSNSRLLRTTENACWRGDKGWPIQLSRISNIHRTSVTSSNNLIQVELWNLGDRNTSS